MLKNWLIKQTASTEEIESLSADINVSKPVANLLLQRGVSNYQEAKDFFRPNLQNLYNPFLMQDMDKAVARIEQAVAAGEKVMVYGDYDVDGTTSVALLYSFLQDKIAQLTYYIPDRYSEGYGVSYKGIDRAKEIGCTLIIALDCGIKAVDKVAYATELGIEFVICDHHEPGETLPKAVAILDPKRSDCTYPFKELSACGVGFKLAQAYAEKNGIDLGNIMPLLDLVVVSIASDIVPIVDENRILAHYGLKRINAKPRIGLKAIIEISNLPLGDIKINDIVFKIGPRINAAGRIELGLHSVDLLVSNDKQTAMEIAKKIDGDNTERREFDSSITKEAIARIESDASQQDKVTTVLYNPDWHKGVLGIVASRLIDHYYRPTIILTRSNGFITGSARSVHDFNLYQAIEACADLLENFGGHMYAAGLTLKEENFEAFRDRFEQVVQEQIQPENLIPKIDVDAEIHIQDISDKFLNVLEQFEPFGPGNMPPVFVTNNVFDTGYAQCVGADKEHLRMYILDKTSRYSYSAIAFGMGHLYEKVEGKKPFQLCYSLEKNNYKGKQSIQLKVRDIK